MGHSVKLTFWNIDLDQSCKGWYQVAAVKATVSQKKVAVAKKNKVKKTDSFDN